ncbi:MAG: hypothetical protein V2I37_02325 [Marinilabiliaceae bacterium]|jgi:hypothetical protein|nr:hypothetical protein [Marinilabiliaceae bacterium]
MAFLTGACTEKYIPEPNQVAFATDLWGWSYYISYDEDWVPVYQLGTTDTEIDHYIYFHVDTINSTGKEGTDFYFPEGDSLLIEKNKYLGYIKIRRSNNPEILSPRVLIILDGNDIIEPKKGMDRCFILF